ncbi:hypothetical protein BOX15_Mlig014748g4 [Macrostomum lignano]|uniref:Chromo domain-containing protein n=1 Tax=Macrostomum lignano TaxID=282301 RepID=A0A267FPB5_9PLAT|nr:hypothetical protein BOX15_Mlig014748g4 [Macrostomum lignano]
METTARRPSNCGAASGTVAAVAAASAVKAGGVSGGLGAKSAPSPPSASNNGDDLYVVGKILAEKTENGMSYFKVRWKNYPPSNDTWEPEDNLTVVSDMIQAFRSARASKLSSGSSSNRASTGGNSNSSNSSGSRKRPAPKRWDQGSSTTAAAAAMHLPTTGGGSAKTNKLVDSLDENRPKSRRRLNGGSGVSVGRESEDASAEDTTGEEGNSNNSEGGSSFANSIGSSSTLEIEGKPTVSAAAATTGSGGQVLKDSTIASAATVGESVQPPTPTQQSASSASSTKPSQHQSPLLADLLGSAKRDSTTAATASASASAAASAAGDASDERSDKAASATASAVSSTPTPPPPPQQQQQPSTSSSASVSTTPIEETAADFRYVANQAELLRAHLAGQAARLPPNRPPPLSWPLLCRAVERGDWPAVSRTVSQQEPQLTIADLQRLLCLAVARGHACIVDLLLDTAGTVAHLSETIDIDCRSPESGLTLLMLAVERDSPALVHRLLLAGADPNLLCPAGNSTLQRAIKLRKPHLVDALCSLGGVDFGVETCEGQTPLRYARRACPQSAAVLQLYVGHLCRTMHDHLADHLARLGFAPAALLFAPRYLRPQPGLVCQVRFRLPEEEASKYGHAVALLHCRQRPCSALMRRQPCPDPISMHCWLSDGPCLVESVQLNGAIQRSLTACGAPFLTALTGPTAGENCLRIAFPRSSASACVAGEAAELRSTLASSSASAGLCGLRIGVFAFRLSALPPAGAAD